MLSWTSLKIKKWETPRITNRFSIQIIRTFSLGKSERTRRSETIWAASMETSEPILVTHMTSLTLPVSRITLARLNKKAPSKLRIVTLLENRLSHCSLKTWEISWFHSAKKSTSINSLLTIATVTTITAKRKRISSTCLWIYSMRRSSKKERMRN